MSPPIPPCLSFLPTTETHTFYPVSSHGQAAQLRPKLPSVHLSAVEPIGRFHLPRMWVYWADPSNRALFHLGDHDRQLIPGLTSRAAPPALQGWLLRAVINSACDQTSQKHIKMPLILSDGLPNKSGAVPRRPGVNGQTDSERGRWRRTALVVRRVIPRLSYRIHVSPIRSDLGLAAHTVFKDTSNRLRTKLT